MGIDKCPKYGFIGPMFMNGDVSIGAIGIVPIGGIPEVAASEPVDGAVLTLLAEEPPSSSLLSAPAAVVILPAMNKNLDFTK